MNFGATSDAASAMTGINIPSSLSQIDFPPSKPNDSNL